MGYKVYLINQEKTNFFTSFLLTYKTQSYILPYMEKHYFTIPFFIPHKGCPFTCIFCGQKKISGKSKCISPSEISAIIPQYLKTIPAGSSNPHIEVGFFGGSFTGLAIEEQSSYLKEVQPFLAHGQVHGIRLSTRPDFIDQRILDMLKKYKVTCIELGVQSMSDIVLKASKRGHTLRDIRTASDLILRNGFLLAHQIMVGLPRSSARKEINTARLSISMGATQIRIYPVVVIKDTELADMREKGLYKALKEYEAIKRCAKLMLLFEKNGVKVIRCGLHPSRGLITGEEIVEGPFHQAFRQKVETYIYGNLLKKCLKGTKVRKSVRKIYYNPAESHSILGHKRVNARYIEETILRKNILTPSSLIPKGSIGIEYENGKSTIISKFTKPYALNT